MPVLAFPISEREIIIRLEEASKRGRLAGYRPGNNGVLFRTSAYGTPFEGLLEAHATSTESGTSLRFTRRIKRTLPIIFCVILLITIWPGVVVTQSLLASMFPKATWLWGTNWYWWVYMLLSVPTAPWAMWKAWKRSNAEIETSSHEMIQKLASELGS